MLFYSSFNCWSLLSSFKDGWWKPVDQLIIWSIHQLSIFRTWFGFVRYGNNGCRRTYLSSRDLQAHVAHRHNENKGREGKEKPEVRNPLAGFSASLYQNVFFPPTVDPWNWLPWFAQNSTYTGISKASLASVVAAVNSAHNTYSSTGSYGTTSGGYGGGSTGAASSQEGMNISVLAAGHSAPPRSATNLITIHAQVIHLVQRDNILQMFKL